MYELARYTAVNGVGTAVLLEALAKRPVGRLVVASSMSIYGEGLYRTADGRLATTPGRPLDQLRRRDWEVRDETGEPMQPVPTPEDKPPTLASVYALTKYDQERLCLMVGEAYGIPTVALRFFNVYGSRQALSNPYTGVLAIFAARYLNGNAPVVFEDGLQQRDFVSVVDVARACALALETDGAPGRGVQRRLRAGGHGPRRGRRVSRGALGREGVAPEITGEYRVGDIRHCFARHRAGAGASSATSRRSTSTRACASSPAGSTGRWRTIGSTGRGASWRRGGSRYEGHRADRPEPGNGAVLVTGGAGFVGTNLAHRLLVVGPARVRLRQPLAARRRAEPRAGFTRPTARACSSRSRTCGGPTPSRAAVREASAGVPPRRAGRGDHEPRRPARRLRGERARAR